jgi:hypothetical protein
MVPGRVLEFTPTRFVPAHQAVEQMEGVLEVQTYGAMLHVFVDDPAVRQPQIEAALTAQGITWGGMREIEARMEEAFISLIQGIREKG